MVNEKRLIDGNALFSEIERRTCLTCNYKDGMCQECPYGEVADMLVDAPTVDAVEAVRCKDCKHYENHKLKVYENCVRNERYIPMNPDDFCSYGQRRLGK